MTHNYSPFLHPMGNRMLLIVSLCTKNIKAHRHVLDSGHTEKVVAMCRSRAGQWTNMDAQPSTSSEVRNEGLSARRLRPAIF